jgi:UDP-N-acetylmuramyl pentapeptide phosphotransferase/UDP-N-acetylglucosamine-1-phosphate transferase
MKTLGIALLVIGLVMTVFTSINLVTEKKVVDLGEIEISKKEKTPIYWSPITGGVLAVAGILVLLLNNKKVST